MLYILIPILAVAIAVFYWFFIMRICKTFELHKKNKLVVILSSAAIAVGLAVLCAFVLSIALWTVHLMVFALIFSIVNLIVEKVGVQKYKDARPWKIIYGTGIVPIVLACVVIFGGYINMMSVTETRYTVDTHKSIRAEGYTVALIADVHFGISVDAQKLNSICGEISEKNPSIVVLCGDIVDENTTKQGMTEVFKALGGIRNEFGVFYVYGNHDRQRYAVNKAYTEEELENTIISSGITVLRDELYSVNEELTVIGREDASYRGESGRTPIAELVSKADGSDFLLALDHQPRQYKENGEAGVDLLLSGHTHGGQIFPMNILFELMSANDANYGYTRITADSQAFVTSGFAGWGFPIKTAAPAEYVIIKISGR